MAELTLVEAVNDALHVELERDAGRAGARRGRRPRRRRLPRDGRAARPLRRRTAASTRRSPRPASSAPRSACAWPAGGRCARCSTTRSRIPCLDQLITHVGRYRWRTGGRMEFPITIRMPYGGGVRAPELHDDSPEAYYVHTPGIKVAIPSTPADAKGLLAAAIRDPDPVVIFEPKLVYRTARGEVPEGELRRAARPGAHRARGERRDADRVRRHGARSASARPSRSTRRARSSTSDRSGRSTRGRSSPRSRKTGRVVIVHEAPRTAGFGAELAALIAEKLDLRPARPGAARHRLRRPVSVLDDRGRTTCHRPSASLAAVRSFDA